jgi:hypothetical protein
MSLVTDSSETVDSYSAAQVILCLGTFIIIITVGFEVFTVMLI